MRSLTTIAAVSFLLFLPFTNAGAQSGHLEQIKGVASATHSTGLTRSQGGGGQHPPAKRNKGTITTAAVPRFQPLPLTKEVRADHVEGIEVVDYGIYRANPIQTQRDTEGILQSSVGNVRHVRTTRQIPARHLVRFGFRFKLLGAPEGAKAFLKKVWIFPSKGLRHPIKGQVLHRLERHIVVTVGETHYTAYKFDEPWELVPGTWTLELWYKGHRLTSQRFTVYLP